MQISEVVIREFEYKLEDVGVRNGHQVYEPGSTATPRGFVLTIRTDEDIQGHYRGFMITPPMIAQIKTVAPEYLIGEDPRNREGIWQTLWRALRHTDHAGLGPIDVALWDVVGKYYDDSVSNLLGGYRTEIPAYASTYFPDREPDGLSSPESFVEYATELLEAGFSAMKIHPFGDPERDIALCEAVSDAVGSEMQLMLDPASEYQTYAQTLKVGRALDRLGFFWYEDPLGDTGQSTHMSGKLVASLDTPILGGEHVRTGPFGVANHLQDDAMDLVRASAHLDGGITSVMKIAHVAESFSLDVELDVGGPAHLHCLSAIRNANYFERGLLHPEVSWMSDHGLRDDVGVVDESGCVSIPSGPGLGVDIDWEFIERRLTEKTVIDTPGGSGLA